MSRDTLSNIDTKMLYVSVGVSVAQGGRLDCRTETLNTCIKLADPLLEHPRYVFPANNEDVDHVCK